MTIYENYLSIKEKINRTAEQSGRSADDITLISVSKTFPASTVQEAIDSGIKILGENKVQEAKDKFNTLSGDYIFHLIGHLQSNKAKDAVKIFDTIHSIDKLSTAEKVANEAIKIDKVQKILIQVNTSGEVNKSGISPSEVVDFCRNIVKIEGIKLLGLMTIGPMTDNNNEIRKSFALLRDLKDEVSQKVTPIKELSMGMSGDYTIAVEEGATMIRVGSAIFGKRDYQL